MASTTPRRGLTILCDVDGVIADLNTEWLRRYNREYGDCLQNEAITEWDMSKFVKPECGQQIFDYLHDPDLYEFVSPYPGAIEGVWALRAFGHRVLFVTSCTGPEMTKAKTQWLFDHGFLQNPLRSGMRDLIITSRKELVRGDVLIDDYPENLAYFPGRKILVDRPWNRDASNFVRAQGWDDIMLRVVERRDAGHDPQGNGTEGSGIMARSESRED